MALFKRAKRTPMHKYSDQPLEPGTWVKVHRDPEYGPGPWPAEPTGHVAGFEEIETLRGRDRMYWVAFDEPQLDTEGDGPYTTSQVLGKYLEALPEHRA